MPHRYDRRKKDEERMQDILRAQQWQDQINKDLVKAGLPAFGYMYNTIEFARDHDVIGRETADKAHLIREHANNAKHDVKRLDAKK